MSLETRAMSIQPSLQDGVQMDSANTTSPFLGLTLRNLKPNRYPPKTTTDRDHRTPVPN